LQRFDQQKPIVVDGKGVIRAGNGTYAAARALGWTHIQIVRSDLAGPDAVAYAIADNRTTDLSAWDKDSLAQQWAALDKELQQIAGFDEAEMQAVLDDAAPLPATSSQPDMKDLAVPEMYQVVVECADEADQQAMFERLRHEGRKCRVLTL
jgi:ParB-like chromosome segregation protein Spo0J